MKLLAALVLLLFAAIPVRAQEGEASGYEGNTLGNLHYRTAAKSYLARVNLAASVNRTEDDWAAGVKSNHYSRSSLNTNVVLFYGISDELFVSVADNYLWSYSSKRENEISGVNSTYSQSGVSNPTLSVDYRFFGGLTGTKFAQFYGAVTPAIFGSRQNATPTSNGNNLSAYSTVTAGLVVDWVDGTQEFGVNPYINFRTSGTYKTSGSPDYTEDSHFNYGVEGVYRYHFSPRNYLGATLTIDAPESMKFNHSSYSETDDYITQFTEVVAWGYKPSETWLYVVSLSNTTISGTYSFTDGTPTVGAYEWGNYLTVTGTHTF